MNSSKATKNLGIWMDHSRALLIDFTNGNAALQTIASDLTPEIKQATLLERGEHTLHQKEQWLDTKYYQAISEKILTYDDVLLFGPTEAKQELMNQLKKDQRYNHIRFCVRTTDKMTEAQQQAFVRNYFSGKDEC